MRNEQYWANLYQRLLEITSHPGYKTPALLQEESDILAELHRKAYPMGVPYFEKEAA